MKIIRDGKEIELTASEIREAGWEWEKMYHIEDLYQYLIEEGCDNKKAMKLAKEMEQAFDDYLCNSCEYADIYHEIMRQVITDYFEGE